MQWISAKFANTFDWGKIRDSVGFCPRWKCITSTAKFKFENWQEYFSPLFYRNSAKILDLEDQSFSR